LPFNKDTFDIVYSANVPERTHDPLKVLFEAARVLRPGGVCHMEIPNFLSYFEGHYMVPQFPIWSNRVLVVWLRILGRDPSFSKTLRLINPLWCRRALAAIGGRYEITPVSLWEEIFLERLSRPFNFETGVGRFATWAVVAILWSGFVRYGVGNSVRDSLGLNGTKYFWFEAWLLYEIFWWWLVSTLIAIFLCFAWDSRAIAHLWLRTSSWLTSNARRKSYRAELNKVSRLSLSRIRPRCLVAASFFVD
jgi:SAM-dependent methyltransferase